MQKHVLGKHGGGLPLPRLLARSKVGHNGCFRCHSDCEVTKVVALSLGFESLKGKSLETMPFYELEGYWGV